jgi:hypothetical protein
VQKHIEPEIHTTDKYVVYYSRWDLFPKHSTINYRQQSYVRMDGEFKVNDKTVESFYALLKRSNYDVHHHVSRKYLGSYCAEATTSARNS